MGIAGYHKLKSDFILKKASEDSYDAQFFLKDKILGLQLRIDIKEKELKRYQTKKTGLKD